MYVIAMGGELTKRINPQPEGPGLSFGVNSLSL
jgi:hypothetical protein